jgi:hypothetical protein
LRIRAGHVDQYLSEPNRVIDLSDELKPQADQGQRMSLPREQPQTNATTPPMDDDEQQMRRALGLHGDAPRSRSEGERQEPVQRGGGAFMQGGVHRRRFVQDGEVPVTVVRRDQTDGAHQGAAHSAVAHSGGAFTGAGLSGPTSSRLQRVEAALAAETAGRERAERALHEAQSAVQALQTKIGHNELAKNEAVGASKRHLEESNSLREQLTVGADLLRETEARAHEGEEALRAVRAELTEERRARKMAERLLHEATDEPESTVAQDIVQVQRSREPVARAPARRGRPPAVHVVAEVEPEPVKWWLLPAKTAAKRR